jgi:Tfp pilus assembly protein PilF
MDFDTAINKAWDDHAADARGVAARLPTLQALVTEESQLERLIALTHHVHGEHLGEWAAGATALEALRALPAYRDASGSGQSMRRSLASLALCGGATPPAMSTSDQIRVHALAASNLAPRDAERASHTLQQALTLAEGSDLPDTDPMHRAIAVAAHNLACTLEEKPARSGDERALMILAAQASRHHWELAGTWLEVERAEYRLAMSWLQAGDFALARQHAQTCLEIVDANGGVALERLFGWQALGLVERAAGDAVGHARAVDMARTAFAQLSTEDQGWCAETIEKMAAAK